MEHQKNNSPEKPSGSKVIGSEIEFLKWCRKMQELVFLSNKKSVQEGFEYFASLKGKNQMRKNRKGSNVNSFEVEMREMIEIGMKISKGIKESYNDVEIYLEDLDKNGKYTDFSNYHQKNLLETYPNNSLWNDLNSYVKKNWEIVKIGFTNLPQDLIFSNKAVLFRYVLVFMMEMNKDKIDLAPDFPAGQETMRIYAELGLAVNDIARWLRTKGIRAQSNHPLGGLVCFPPLAGKSGMGGQGAQGFLITPEFGPRQRLAPIFIEEKIFKLTDNTEHDWIEKYCNICGKCIEKCPTKAINKKKRVNIPDIPTFGDMKTCIDREKCYPYFQEKMGCSICLAVCPFSNGIETYNKLKRKFS